ncbi:cytochrome c1 [Oryzomicrobium sp.]|uniref:cytochrome c1 n=1 Tax=Oryzomicrobium sp. TaxID=1911578 RepID=UPI002FE224A2
MKKLLTALLFAPFLAFANGAELHLDKAPDVQGDKAALQNGAKLFVNYCLNCHGASYVRYNRLTELGLTEDQIKDNLMFTAEKIGEPMRVAIRSDEAKKWFGATPPDLSVIARSRASEFGSGADWLYTYLRSFYRDENRPTGWNNVVFENVGMPHILYELQGVQKLNAEHKLELVTPGKLSAAEYDKQVADLVGFLVWIGEPQAGFRKSLGLGVLAFLAVLFVLAYALKREYWKDVH